MDLDGFTIFALLSGGLLTLFRSMARRTMQRVEDRAGEATVEIVMLFKDIGAARAQSRLAEYRSPFSVAAMELVIAAHGTRGAPARCEELGHRVAALGGGPWDLLLTLLALTNCAGALWGPCTCCYLTVAFPGWWGEADPADGSQLMVWEVVLVVLALFGLLAWSSIRAQRRRLAAQLGEMLERVEIAAWWALRAEAPPSSTDGEGEPPRAAR